MRTWTELYRDVERLDVSERRASAEREGFERWAVSAEERILTAVLAAATGRSQELLDHTGLVVRGSRVPSPPRTSADGAHFGVVSLSLGTSRVDVYSVRQLGESPALHLGVMRGATTTRFPVLAAVPGALVVRGAGDALELLPLPVPRDDGDRTRRTTTVDALVLRAFDLLIGAHRSVGTSVPAYGAR